jgi:putative ABC transport system permease protein
MMRTFAVLLRLAVRSLGRNRRRSLITLAAMALGVALVVLAFGIGEGMKNMLVTQAVEGRTGALQVHRKGYLDEQEAMPLDLTLPYDEDFLARLERTTGVRAAAGRLSFGGLASNGTISSMVVVQGFDPVRERKVTPRRAAELKPGDGGWLTPERESGAVVGRQLADSMEQELGGLLTLTAAGPGGAMNALDLDVAGIVTGGVMFESKRSVQVPLAYAQTLLDMEGKVTEYAVAVDDLGRVDEVKAALERALGPEVEVSTWGEVQPFLWDMTQRVGIILRIVSFVLFAIVVLGVINTMLMSVFERVREIGTLLAIGLRRRQVLWLFLTEALLLGAVGGTVGAALGYGLTALLGARGIVFQLPGNATVETLRPVPLASVALLALVVSALGAVVAAAWPARKASLMNPVDALRA